MADERNPLGPGLIAAGGIVAAIYAVNRFRRPPYESFLTPVRRRPLVRRNPLAPVEMTLLEPPVEMVLPRPARTTTLDMTVSADPLQRGLTRSRAPTVIDVRPVAPELVPAPRVTVLPGEDFSLSVEGTANPLRGQYDPLNTPRRIYNDRFGGTPYRPQLPPEQPALLEGPLFRPSSDEGLTLTEARAMLRSQSARAGALTRRMNRLFPFEPTSGTLFDYRPGPATIVRLNAAYPRPSVSSMAVADAAAQARALVELRGAGIPIDRYLAERAAAQAAAFDVQTAANLRIINAQLGRPLGSPPLATIVETHLPLPPAGTAFQNPLTPELLAGELRERIAEEAFERQLANASRRVIDRRLERRFANDIITGASQAGEAEIRVGRSVLVYTADPTIPGRAIVSVAGRDLAEAAPGLAAELRARGFTSVGYSPLGSGTRREARVRLFERIINSQMSAPIIEPPVGRVLIGGQLVEIPGDVTRVIQPSVVENPLPLPPRVAPGTVVRLPSRVTQLSPTLAQGLPLNDPPRVVTGLLPQMVGYEGTFTADLVAAVNRRQTARLAGGLPPASYTRAGVPALLEVGTARTVAGVRNVYNRIDAFAGRNLVRAELGLMYAQAAVEVGPAILHGIDLAAESVGLRPRLIERLNNDLVRLGLANDPAMRGINENLDRPIRILPARPQTFNESVDELLSETPAQRADRLYRETTARNRLEFLQEQRDYQAQVAEDRFNTALNAGLQIAGLTLQTVNQSVVQDAALQAAYDEVFDAEVQAGGGPASITNPLPAPLVIRHRRRGGRVGTFAPFTPRPTPPRPTGTNPLARAIAASVVPVRTARPLVAACDCR